MEPVPVCIQVGTLLIEGRENKGDRLKGGGGVGGAFCKCGL